MNISGCAQGCSGNLHKSFCLETGNRAADHGSAKERSGKTAGDSIDISREARAMKIQAAEAHENRKETEKISSEKLEDDEEFLHEGHDHSHDDEDDHDGLARQIANQKELSKEELKELRELQSRDRQVRNHEQAHVAASGSIATSGPTYEYEQGPDGRKYAVGGSVSYNVPPADSPEEELRLAQQLRRMALAPMDPSPKDRATAAKAAAKEAKASREIREERAEEFSSDEKSGEGSPGVTGSVHAAEPTSQARKAEKENEPGTLSAPLEQGASPAHPVQPYEEQSMNSSPGLLISTVV